MPEDMEHTGVAAGRHDINHEGQNRVIYDEWELQTYDPDSDGTGNSFDPSLLYGMSRVGVVHAEVADDSAYLARYDYEEKSIRLFEMGGSEVTGGTEVNVPIRVNVRGMGP